MGHFRSSTGGIISFSCEAGAKKDSFDLFFLEREALFPLAAGFRLPVPPLDFLPKTTSASESESEILPSTCLLFLIFALDERVSFRANTK